ncbi:MAG: ClcB-like voltage-gated chloride channel protein [Alphaproteobacteria bacterium]|nr:ClcB-like voltage-gated chloride channel protein [Alphaproteobacteria bacterium]
MPRFFFHRLLRARSGFPGGDYLALLLLAAVVGVCGAMAALVFRSAFIGIQHAFGPDVTGMVALARSLQWWQRLLMPACGGALAGACLKFGLDWVPRRGADDYLEAITMGDGVIGMRQSLIKSVSSLCSIGSGASIGREGSMVQLSAMIGSAIGQLLRMRSERLRLLVACGATAGITSAYNAPIAGCIFIIELSTRELGKEMLGPLIVASVIANMITRLVFGFQPVYRMPDFPPIAGWEVFAFAGLGIVCGFAGPLFRRTLDISRVGFSRLKAGLIVNMTLGGLGVGLISVWEPNVWGNGYSVVNSILHSSWGWQALLAILLLKVLATALCSGSGAVGGVFTPTLFVGAALGALYGHWMTGLAPLADTGIPGYAMVGMGALLASVTYAPLMCILMIFEMTLSYEIILPLMLACVIAHAIAHIIRPLSIYAQRSEKGRSHLLRQEVAGRQ